MNRNRKNSTENENENARGFSPAGIRELLLIGPIRFYQRFLSPLKPSPTCRFFPCCSAYAATALRRFGLLRGGLMALCRVLRCNPLCKGGVDPVPNYFTLRPFAGLEEKP